MAKRKPAERISGAELARRLGVSPGAVTYAIKAGRIKRGPDGKFDAATALRDYQRSQAKAPGPGRGHMVAPSSASDDRAEDNCPSCGRIRDLQYWRTLSEREKYRTTRLGRLELEGTLIKRSVADETIAELGAITRGLLEGVAASIRDDLAAETDVRRCGDIVDGEIRLVLEQAAQQFAAIAGEALTPAGEDFSDVEDEREDDDGGGPD
ncbi:MAG: winged helix-turn-helix domain-containing protein [Myxococcales bacterium]|nr:winged helix-turn-helix domain-containing protein [Myxococcales bacterium]